MSDINLSKDPEHKDEYNRSGFLAFLFSFAFVVSFFVYLVMVNRGVDLGENIVDPQSKTQVNEAQAFDVKKVKEPWVSTSELVGYGQKVFSANCAMCHGAEGKGDGAAGAGLTPPPRSLVQGQWKMGAGLIAKYKVITEGIKGSSMAAYGHLSPGDRWALAHFIQSITENKGEDTPEQVTQFAQSAL